MKNLLKLLILLVLVIIGCSSSPGNEKIKQTTSPVTSSEYGADSMDVNISIFLGETTVIGHQTITDISYPGSTLPESTWGACYVQMMDGPFTSKYASIELYRDTSTGKWALLALRNYTDAGPRFSVKCVLLSQFTNAGFGMWGMTEYSLSGTTDAAGNLNTTGAAIPEKLCFLSKIGGYVSFPGPGNAQFQVLQATPIQLFIRDGAPLGPYSVKGYCLERAFTSWRYFPNFMNSSGWLGLTVEQQLWDSSNSICPLNTMSRNNAGPGEFVNIFDYNTPGWKYWVDINTQHINASCAPLDQSM